MKLTKKAAALLLAASLAVSVCATPVFATGYDMGSGTVNGSSKNPDGPLLGNHDTKVYYKVTESYQWTVPATIDFGEDAGVGNTSTVEAKLGKDESGVQAKKSADNTWKGTAPKVTVTKNVIGPGKNLQITIDTDYTEGGKFYVETPKMTAAGPSQTEYEKLYYTIAKPATAGGNKEELTTNKNEVLRVPSGQATDEQELVFTLTTTTKAAEQAGTYEGHVFFHSQLVY